MISIITSTYNSKRFLKTFLQNVEKFHSGLLESKIQFEHIIIANDPSSEEISILQNGKVTLRIIEVPRESLYASWNRGIKMAAGDFVTFWNVDDVRFAESTVKAVKEFERKSVNLVYFPFIYKRYLNVFGLAILAKRYTVNPPDFDKEEFTRHMHCGPHFIFRKSTVNTAGYFDESFKIVGDFEWCRRYAQEYAFTKLNVVSGVFQSFGNGLSTRSREENLRELKRIQR